MRLILLALAFAAITLEAAHAQAPPMLTPEQREKLKDRDALVRETNKLQKSGKFAEAIAAAEKVLALERRVLGETHADVLESIKWLAGLQEELGDYSTAAKNWADLANLRTKAYGKNHWQTIDARLATKNAEQIAGLNTKQRSLLQNAKWNAQVAALYYGKGQFLEALPLAEKVVRIRKEVLGEKHLDYALSLNDLARLYDSQGQYAKAEPLYLDALRIRKEVLAARFRIEVFLPFH